MPARSLTRTAMLPPEREAVRRRPLADTTATCPSSITPRQRGATCTIDRKVAQNEYPRHRGRNIRPVYAIRSRLLHSWTTIHQIPPARERPSPVRTPESHRKTATTPSSATRRCTAEYNAYQRFCCALINPPCAALPTPWGQRALTFGGAEQINVIAPPRFTCATGATGKCDIAVTKASNRLPQPYPVPSLCTSQYRPV
jgi:hypothetical protein